MKIIYLHQYYNTSEASGGTRSYEISKHLIDNGHEVIMIGGDEIDLNNIYDDFPERFIYKSTRTKYNNHMSFLNRLISFLHYAYKAILLGRSIKGADIIYATSTPLTIGIPAYRLSRKLNIPFVFEVRDVWPEVPIGLGFIKNKIVIKLLKKFENKIYEKTRHIIALSDGMCDSIISKGIPSNKVTVVTNFSNIKLFEKNKFDSEKIREKYNCTNKQFLCIHAGTMGFINGLDYVLNAAIYLLQKDPEVVFLLIGDGKDRERLLKRIKMESILNVKIVDPVSKIDIKDIIMSSDVGLMTVINNPVLLNNSANKFFDYLAAGIPIIINYGGWQKEVLRNAGAGYSVRSDNPKDMVKKLLELKNNKELCKEMGREARLLAEKSYSRDEGCKKIENILLNVLSNFN